MQGLVESACPRCGRSHDERTLVCELCGQLLRREGRRIEAREPATIARGEAPAAPEPALFAMRSMRGARLEPWLYLGLGLVSAPLLAWTPILRFMGWFLAALVHEMGHATAAWFFGMPAVPAISLGGHAAAVHGPQSPLVLLVVAACLCSVAARCTVGRRRWIALGVIALVYPALAFSGAKDLLHLLAGHGAELAFATLCLWKALDGGFTDSRLERGLYGTLGWFLLGTNARLCVGLMTSAAARGEYRSSGSFGLTNDYLRVAEELLGWRLPSVALLMLVACACVLPAAIAAWYAGSSRAGPRTVVAVEPRPLIAARSRTGCAE